MNKLKTIKMTTTELLSAPTTCEIDTTNGLVHISEYGENLITLSFSDINKLHSEVERCQNEKVSKIMQFFKKVID